MRAFFDCVHKYGTDEPENSRNWPFFYRVVGQMISKQYISQVSLKREDVPFF